MLPNKVSATHGFSLLELLVVLIVIGLISGIALPQLQRSLNSYQYLAEKNQLIKALNSLTGVAYQYGENFEISKLPSEDGWINELIDIPNGWGISSENPLKFYSSGSCSGGNITIIKEKQKIKYKLSPPFCLMSPDLTNGG